jgi:uncharacterized membrane protein YeaQ/YmgE (transglycosylase-associated protein family)
MSVSKIRAPEDGSNVGYYVTIDRKEGSEGGGHGRLDRRRATQVRDGRVDPTWSNSAGIGVALLLGAAGSLLARFVVGLSEGAESTRFGVDAILWAVLGAFAVLAIYRFIASLRAQ